MKRMGKVVVVLASCWPLVVGCGGKTTAANPLTNGGSEPAQDLAEAARAGSGATNSQEGGTGATGSGPSASAGAETSGPAAKSGSGDPLANSPEHSIPPGMQQWEGCQCGGSCDGATPPGDDYAVACTPEIGLFTPDGAYAPCGGLTCGTACAACLPDSPDCPYSVNEVSGLLCNRDGNCVPAAEVSCL